MGIMSLMGDIVSSDMVQNIFITCDNINYQYAYSILDHRMRLCEIYGTSV
jgi:hypothetical protein